MSHFAHCKAVPISIHAPHDGERRRRLQGRGRGNRFQSTLPTMGSDGNANIFDGDDKYFNPRSPRWGATCLFSQVAAPLFHFNPRSPRWGATRSCSSAVGGIAGFQSTLPTMGSDANGAYDAIARDKFQSTLPTMGSDSGKVHLYAAFPRIY